MILRILVCKTAKNTHYATSFQNTHFWQHQEFAKQIIYTKSKYFLIIWSKLAIWFFAVKKRKIFHFEKWSKVYQQNLRKFLGLAGLYKGELMLCVYTF